MLKFFAVLGRGFRVIERTVTHAAEVVGKVLLSLMVLVVSYICFTRYVLNYTPAWGEELALLCMVWFGFMAIALGVRADAHIGVTLFDKYFPPKMLRALNFFKIFCLLAFAGWFMYPEGVKMARVGSWNQLPGLGISSYWMYIIVAASGVAIVVYSLEKLYDQVKGEKKEGEGHDV